MPDLILQPVTDPVLDDLVDHLYARRHLGEQADPDLARAAAMAQVERVRERATAYDVVGSGEPVGRVWTVDQGDDTAVLHLRLDDAGLAPAVRGLVADLAREVGARRLTIGVFPADPVTEGFVVGGGFEVAATQMRLDLASDLPAEDVVVLAPMDDEAYARWEQDEVESYAQARAKSGETYEVALKTSIEQHEQLLPDGLATEHHAFFVGMVEGEQVGTLWIGTERPMAFVYDVVVDEAHRRKGYGAGLMRAGALWSREHGSHALGLNVFGYNHGARALYDRLGYHVVEEFVGLEL